MANTAARVATTKPSTSNSTVRRPICASTPRSAEGLVRGALEPSGRRGRRGRRDDDAEQWHDQGKPDAFENGARGDERRGDDAATAGVEGDVTQQGERLPAAARDAILRCAHAPVHGGLWHRLLL